MMGRLFAIFIVISLILPSYLASEENVIVIVRDYKGIERKAVISNEERNELENLLMKLIEKENYNCLDIIFEKLKNLKLIEDIELKYFKNNVSLSLFPFYANFLCLIFGYGNNSWIETPSSISIILLWALLSHLDFNFLEWLFISLYSYYHFYPKSYLPIAGWIIAGEGKVNVIGLFGYKRLLPKENFECPMLIILYRFLGIAITFLAEGYEKTYVVGASMAMLAI